MLILQTFHKGESEVEPRVVFVEILEVSNFHESQNVVLSLIGF